jgi:hypothetical protein
LISFLELVAGSSMPPGGRSANLHYDLSNLTHGTNNCRQHHRHCEVLASVFETLGHLCPASLLVLNLMIRLSRA